jgi:hypothetical protein
MITDRFTLQGNIQIIALHDLWWLKDLYVTIMPSVLNVLRLESVVWLHVVQNMVSCVNCVVAFGLETWPMLILDRKHEDDKSWMRTRKWDIVGWNDE